YAASSLLKQNNSIAFHDMMFAKKASEIEAVIIKNKPEYFVIYDDGFNYLTKMCLTNMRNAAFEMATIAKKLGCKVIVSSSDATDHSLEYFNNHVDFIIVGEGEQSLVELIAQLKNKQKNFSAINGLRYPENEKLIETSGRENLKNLDSLPMPAWHLLDVQPYKKCWLGKYGYFSINIATTRGCPFKCNWCAKPIYGNRYNSRSPQNVIDELLWLKEHFHFDHIWFCDDIFGLKPGWVNEFADLVNAHQLHLKFKIQSRVDLLLEDHLPDQKESTIEALSRAGCDEVWLGAESGSQKILDAMDKGTKIEQIHRATKLLWSKGIKPCFFLQFGYSGETMDDIKLTMKMLFELMPHDIGVSVSYPLPGTKFYENVKSQMQGKTNWTDSDELAAMFNATFPSGFYKKLQRYVHYQFRIKKLLESIKKGNMAASLFTLSYKIPLAMYSKFVIQKYVH
ncbi:MAG: radical SAM protein, partial [Bacteroidota bacterium]|nr:radical SAM protein [Bacteroidota bacterium]